MRFQASIQIILVIVSVIIITAVIKPKFAEIQDKQNETLAYGRAVEKADIYNARLQEKVAKIENFPQSDFEALNTFLPETIDATLVSRDIVEIVEKHVLLLQGIKASDVTPVTVANATEESYVNATEQSYLLSSDDVPPALVSQQFSVSVVGGYEEMKGMLQDIERNSYPLRIVKFAFESDGDSALYDFSLTVETYALNENK